MDKFNAGLVYWKDMPYNIKAEIRAARHVQWNGGNSGDLWLDFTGRKQRSHSLGKLHYICYRVKPGTEHLLMPVRKPRKAKPYITLNITRGEAKVLRRLLKELDGQT